MTRVQTMVRSGPGPWLAVGYGCVLAVLSFGPRANLDSFFAPIRSEGHNGGEQCRPGIGRTKNTS